MIDVQAVLKHLEDLRIAAGTGAPTAFANYLGQSQAQHSHDAAGNEWITLPGESDRAVVIGGYMGTNTGSGALDNRLGLVTGLETIRALAKRTDGRPPCTIQLVAWADAARAAVVPQTTAAYLELHIEPGSDLESGKSSLGVVVASSASESVVFNPRLIALCDEAIRELTGTSAALTSKTSGTATAVAQAGIPTAMMYVQTLSASADGTLPADARLHLLQAAEAFGRWVEATMHLVAGEGIDLWAKENRVPHSQD